MSPDDVLRIRTAAGLTQVEFAERIGATPLSVSRWERGETKPIPIFERAILELDSGQKKTDLPR